MHHRGPDASGEFVLPWGGLSHVRLSLIAPGSAGSQPRKSKKFCLIFNGEIFNWKDLSKELSAQGVVHSSNSDTETLLISLEIWGIKKTVEKLRGIFAFVLLDLVNESLFIVRDASGTKPIYYFSFSGNIYVASEIKAFKKFGLEINKEALNEYMTFQNFLGTQTLFKNVNIVSPGSIYEFKKGNADPIIYIWDSGNFRSDLVISEQEAILKMEDLLLKAVERNLYADFPVGSFLSGGIDSSLLAIAIKKNLFDINFFTVGFNNQGISDYEKKFDERKIASNFAKQLRLRHSVSEVDYKFMEEKFDELCWSIEEPRVGQSYPNLYAAISAKKMVKACISGTGGDELFGGYPWRYKSVLATRNLGKEEQISAYLSFWNRLGDLNEISSLLRLNAADYHVRSRSLMRIILEANSTDSNEYKLEDLLYFEYKTFLHGLLIVEDKLSMSQSLETRVPFLDQDLVKFAQNLPNSLRVFLGPQYSYPSSKGKPGVKLEQIEGKVLLRKLSKHWSNPLSELPKQGFSGPDESWFRKQSLNFVAERLLNKEARIWQDLDYGVGTKLVQSHLSGIKNRRLLIWSLMSLESVYNQFL